MIRFPICRLPCRGRVSFISMALRSATIVRLLLCRRKKSRRSWDELLRANYEGVLTLEIFSEEDFLSSLEVIGKIA